MTPQEKWDALRRHTITAYNEASALPGGPLTNGFLVGLKRVLDGMDALDQK